MLRWLSRYVKKIDIYGIGIELREIPEAEALPLLAQPPWPGTPTAPAGSLKAEPPPAVQRKDYVSVSGVSPSSQRSPRELDLTLEGDEIEFHIHNPGGTQTKVWVVCNALQEAMEKWQSDGRAGPIAVKARRSRKEAEVVFVVESKGEVEVQAHWWIWVPREDMKAALEALGVRVPWR